MAVGEVRPGYELWHPNRERADVIATRVAIVLLMVATSATAALIAITGFPLLSGGGGMGVVCLVWAALYALFAFLATRWSRGVLPISAAFSMILAIFAAVGIDSWFARDKAGFEEALLPSSLIGVLVIVLTLLQIVLIAVALYAFNQDWHVEEERPIGSGEDYGAGASRPPGAPQTA